MDIRKGLTKILGT